LAAHKKAVRAEAQHGRRPQPKEDWPLDCTGSQFFSISAVSKHSEQHASCLKDAENTEKARHRFLCVLCVFGGNLFFGYWTFEQVANVIETLVRFATGGVDL
jgi:hypothetical protein